MKYITFILNKESLYKQIIKYYSVARILDPWQTYLNLWNYVWIYQQKSNEC